MGTARVAAPLLLLALLASCARVDDSCDVCERETCRGIRFSVTFTDGSEKLTCCPRCASHVVAQAGGLEEVSRLEARDFASGEPVSARKATYVEGSDMEHCRGESAKAVRRGMDGGCCDVLAMDRCRPSLLAFGSAEKAAEFARLHGGTVKSFDDLRFGQPRRD
jgi:hypothetical protein